jgi:hypothetical protein
MSEELPTIHIDSDWKKQAQAEKKRLAEQAASAKPPAAPAPVAVPSARVGSAATAVGARRGRGQLPPPGFASLVQSVMTQVLYYLGELSASTGQPAVDLDMAKHHLDTLSMLEEKTKNNLTPEETSLLDAALYETRSRFVNMATQFLGP